MVGSGYYYHYLCCCYYYYYYYYIVLLLQMLLLFFPIVADAISTAATITSAFDSLEIRDSGFVAVQFHKNTLLKRLRCIYGTRDF